MEESDGDLDDVRIKKRKDKKKRKPLHSYIVEDVTERDVQMADAYGGEAKPRVRKVGPNQRFATQAQHNRTNTRGNLSTGGNSRSRPDGNKQL